MTSNQTQNLVLVCADGKRVVTDKLNLVASSGLVRGMFDTGPNDGVVGEVPVTEKAEVMERVLPYCGSAKVPLIDIATSPDNFWSIARVCDKYEIGRGLDAAAFALKLDNSSDPQAPRALARTYLHGFNFSPEDLPAVLDSIIEEHLTWDQPSSSFTEAARSGVGDGNKLQSLLNKRTSILAGQRDRLYAKASLPSGGGVSLPLSKFGSVSSSSLSNAPSTWRQSGSCMTVKALQRFQNRGLTDGRSTWMPWTELEQVLRDLPAKLE